MRSPIVPDIPSGAGGPPADAPVAALDTRAVIAQCLLAVKGFGTTTLGGCARSLLEPVLGREFMSDAHV